MNNLTISTGIITLTINNDPNRVISFNPDDIDFTAALYDLIASFDRQSKDFIEKEKALLQNQEVDDYGIPSNMGDRVTLSRDVCNMLRESIDKVFGQGTSQTAFGTQNTLDMFGQFFDGITPFVQKARNKRMQPYTNKASHSGVME